MAFSGKIDDEAGIAQPPRLENKDTPRTQFSFFAGLDISLKIIREGFFKLKSNAPTHDTLTIHGIDKGFDVFFENIPTLIFDHLHPSSQ